jgi:hypothetical protein
MQAGSAGCVSRHRVQAKSVCICVPVGVTGKRSDFFLWNRRKRVVGELCVVFWVGVLLACLLEATSICVRLSVVGSMGGGVHAIVAVKVCSAGCACCSVDRCTIPWTQTGCTRSDVQRNRHVGCISLCAVTTQ